MKEVPNNLADAEAPPPPPWVDAVADRLETRYTSPPLSSYHISSPQVKPFGRRYGSQKKFVDAEAPPPWDGGGADPIETGYSLTRVTVKTERQGIR